MEEDKEARHSLTLIERDKKRKEVKRLNRQTDSQIVR